MKYTFSIIISLIVSTTIFGQKKLEKTLKKFNSESVPYISVDQLAATSEAIILDSRKPEEYNVSHLKNAIWVGYDAFDTNTVETKIKDKSTPVIVYCSIGVRSEDIGEKLQKMGYTNVKNLYGGIFEWKNQGHAVYNNNTSETDSVHTYNKQWGKLLNKGVKVY